MSERKNVCLIDGPQSLVAGFRDIGCQVLDLRASPAPFFSLPEALDEAGFRPDLVLQVEALGGRSLVIGLEQVECPVMAWCVDPHLNGYWHGAWARLFDLTCSTQTRWLGDVRACGAEDVRWLPWYGHEQPWVPVAERTTDIAFVGRITPHRPARKWMVEFLETRTDDCSVAVRQDLGFGDMMNLYRSAKIAPNESIFGEINFRLFEAASCGCLVLDQDLGESQAALFEPGREIETCAHVAELDDKLGRYLGNDRLVQAMGRAAYERVQAEHLVTHRARRLLEFADEAADRRARGAQADTWTGLTAAAMWEGGRLAVPVSRVLSLLERAERNGDVVAALLRVQAMSGMDRAVGENLAAILGGQLYADNSELNLTGSMAALRIGRFDSAKGFWFRHCLATGVRDPGQPSDETTLLTLWAKDLHRRGQAMRGGFAFDPEVHLPGSASECLLAILSRDPAHLDTLRLLDTVYRPLLGMEQARVGFLSILTLREREDWRLALEIGLANLKSFRLESGLEELRLALGIARNTGQESRFLRVLKGRDPSGLLTALVE